MMESRKRERLEMYFQSLNHSVLTPDLVQPLTSKQCVCLWLVGLHLGLFSSCSNQGYSLVEVHVLLFAVASLVEHGLSSCGT